MRQMKVCKMFLRFKAILGKVYSRSARLSGTHASELILELAEGLLEPMLGSLEEQFLGGCLGVFSMLLIS